MKYKHNIRMQQITNITIQLYQSLYPSSISSWMNYLSWTFLSQCIKCIFFSYAILNICAICLTNIGLGVMSELLKNKFVYLLLLGLFLYNGFWNVHTWWVESLALLCGCWLGCYAVEGFWKYGRKMNRAKKMRTKLLVLLLLLWIGEGLVLLYCSKISRTIDDEKLLPLLLAQFVCLLLSLYGEGYTLFYLLAWTILNLVPMLRVAVSQLEWLFPIEIIPLLMICKVGYQAEKNKPQWLKSFHESVTLFYLYCLMQSPHIQPQYTFMCMIVLTVVYCTVRQKFL